MTCFSHKPVGLGGFFSDVFSAVGGAVKSVVGVFVGPGSITKSIVSSPFFQNLGKAVATATGFPSVAQVIDIAQKVHKARSQGAAPLVAQSGAISQAKLNDIGTISAEVPKDDAAALDQAQRMVSALQSVQDDVLKQSDPAYYQLWYSEGGPDALKTWQDQVAALNAKGAGTSSVMMWILGGIAAFAVLS